MGTELIAPNSQDREVKRARVIELLDDAGAEAVVLRSAAATSWYLDGARTHVSLAGAPVLAVHVDRDSDTVLLAESESARVIAEELPADVDVRPVAWFDALATRGALEEADIAVRLRALRAPLLPAETARLRALSIDAAQAVTTAVLRATPAMTERALAASVGAGLIERGIDPLVVLVGGHDRRLFRHPLPTGGVLGRRALVVVCGRRQGLIADLSRWVAFGSITPEEADRDRAILNVEAGYWDALAVGRPLADVLAAGASGYAVAGFDADEWRNHHQGGVAGYDGRDPRATPAVTDIVAASQAFAWNPSGPGAKVEDTVLFNGVDVEILTTDGRWPVIEHAGRLRPALLQL